MLLFLGRLLLSLFISLLLLSPNLMSDIGEQGDDGRNHQYLKPNLGVIVDNSTLMGKETKIAMEIAVVDLNAHLDGHGPILHVRNSRRDPLRAASFAEELINKHQVGAIISGFKKWEETVVIAELGNKSEVPILSLANDAPIWYSRQWPFVVNAVHNQYAQMKAVAAIVQSWKWRRVSLIYEDVNSAINGIIPPLINALHEVQSEIVDYVPLPPLPPYFLSKHLESLKRGQCRVFIVHTSITLATSLFLEAKKMGMMEEEFVWIATDGFTSRVDSLNASTFSSMQGVLGVKNHFSHTEKQYSDFSSQFRTMFQSEYPDEPYVEPGISALQAYDAVWAVASAMEGHSNQRTVGKGWQLLDRILRSNFAGLTGEFKLREGALPPAHIFRIINVVGKSYRELGYWSDGLGFSVSIGKGSIYKKSMRILGQVLWPGGPWSIPRGWAVPTSARPLKIGVPANTTFDDFVKWRNDHHHGGVPIVDGFSIRVFKEAVKLLTYNFSYEFVPFPGPYDVLVKQIPLKKFDAVVGDTAIVANRFEYGEFSQPYADSGLQMVVYEKPQQGAGRAWLITKPFSKLLWFFTIVVNIYNGFVVWFIEQKDNPDLRGSLKNQIGNTIWLAFTTLFTALQGDKLHSILTRMATVVWLFVALVTTSSYTASLTSLLTAERLSPGKVNFETLKQSGAKVGCDGNSFVVKYLENIGFNRNNIIKLYSGDEYPQALMRGEIAAAFLEAPYVKVLLAKYCNGFTTSGPTLKVGGFGFVFPRGSPMLPDISQAILKLSEKGKLRELETSLVSSHNCSALESDDHGSLGMNSFWGLFFITAAASSTALLIFMFANNFYQLASGQEGEHQHHHHHPNQDEACIFAPEMEILARRSLTNS